MADPQKQAGQGDESRDKLGRFAKGHSGNPGGMKKGTVSLTRHLRDVLSENDHDKARQVAEVMVRAILDGDTDRAAMCRMVLERIDGAVVRDATGDEKGGYRLIVNGINLDRLGPEADDDEEES